MSTADISDANDGLAGSNPSASVRTPPALSKRISALAGKLRPSPSSRRTLVLIFSLFGVYVAADIALSESSAGSRIELVAQLVAAGLDNVADDMAETSFAPIARILDTDLFVRITDRDDVPILSSGTGSKADPANLLPDVSAERSIAGPLGTVEVRLAHQAILEPVVWRALLGFVFAGFLAIRAARRAERTEAQQRAHMLTAAMARAADGIAIWDRARMLVAVSGNFAEAGVVPPALLRRGAPQAGFLDGLRHAGELKELSASGRERHLRLVLKNEEVWDLREHVTEDGLLITHFSDDSARTRLNSEAARLRSRVGEMIGELQTQRVRGDAASRSKTLFLSQLSHSLRTPLNHIIGFADLLHHQSFGPIGDTRYLSYAANIKQSGEALLDQLSNMLELAEFDSGQRVLNREQIRMGELFDWAEMRYREQARRAGIDIVMERADDIVVLGDRLGLRRMIGSIIDNSLKFTPKGGSVTIAAWHSSDGVVLEFTDTGIGIGADTLTVLNTSFALSHDRHGNGIAIARAIAELSGGQLQINSSPGIGTTVAVVLPLKSGAASDARMSQVA